MVAKAVPAAIEKARQPETARLHMHYLTRHLEALRDLPVGDALVATGGRFYATEVDADYLVGSKSARDLGAGASAAKALSAEPAPPTAPAVNVAEVLQPTRAPAAVEPAVEPVPAAEPAANLQPEPTSETAEEAVAASAPESRRRGRPSNADRLARQAADAGVDVRAASES